MAESTKNNNSLAQLLIQDELFDLTLYQKLYAALGCEKIQDAYATTVHRGAPAGGEHLCGILNDLIPVEQKHLVFWQDFFGKKENRLDRARKIKLAGITALSRVFGKNFIGLVLQAIEIYGIRKYIALWELYKNQPLGKAVTEVLNDELAHESDIILTLSARKMNPEKVRNFFLGFNDGLVEILGAISGFFAALQDTITVLIAALMVAVAGAVSMAAGIYVATSSEREMHALEGGRAKFLGREHRVPDAHAEPFSASLIVGTSYFAGAIIPVLPVLFGAKSMFFSVSIGAIMVVFVSFVLAFLSGINIKKRIGMNLIMITAAVAISYTIGSVVRNILGIGV